KIIIIAPVIKLKRKLIKAGSITENDEGGGILRINSIESGVSKAPINIPRRSV
ncbi:unnamed protein product, partial [marine sediment metagenome]